MSQESLNFADKGIKPVTKFVFYSLLSIALLSADHHLALAGSLRSHLMTLTYPIFNAISAPIRVFEKAQTFLSSHAALISENHQLQSQNSQLTAKISHYEALAQHFHNLENLFHLSQENIDFVTVAQVVGDGHYPLSERIIINKGTRDGVRTGQAAADAHGLIGQVTAVSPLGAEITLINAQNSVIPVMVARTGFRTLLYGNSTHLDLRYFPADADLKINDLLVTSGVDNHFVAGIPVARIESLEKAGGTPYFQVQTRAMGQLSSASHVMIFPQNRLDNTTNPTQPNVENPHD